MYTHVLTLWHRCASPGPPLPECTGSWNSLDTLNKRRLRAGQDRAFVVPLQTPFEISKLLIGGIFQLIFPGSAL